MTLTVHMIWSCCFHLCPMVLFFLHLNQFFVLFLRLLRVFEKCSCFFFPLFFFPGNNFAIICTFIACVGLAAAPMSHFFVCYVCSRTIMAWKQILIVAGLIHLFKPKSKFILSNKAARSQRQKEKAGVERAELRRNVWTWERLAGVIKQIST